MGGLTIRSVNCRRLGICDSRLFFVGLMSRDVITYMAARKDETKNWPHGCRVIRAFGAMTLQANTDIESYTHDLAVALS